MVVDTTAPLLALLNGRGVPMFARSGPAEENRHLAGWTVYTGGSQDIAGPTYS